MKKFSSESKKKFLLLVRSSDSRGLGLVSVVITLAQHPRVVVPWEQGLSYQPMLIENSRI